MNKFMCIGNMTRDPDFTDGETPRANFAIAINEGKGKPPVFVNCTAWAGTAQIVRNNFKKGMRVCLYGKITTNSKDGKSYWGMNVFEVFFVDGNKKGSTETDEEVPA